MKKSKISIDIVELVKVLVPLLTVIVTILLTTERTNNNIENVENHFKLLPGQLYGVPHE